MFRQIQSLGMQPWACGFNIFDKDEKSSYSIHESG